MKIDIHVHSTLTSSTALSVPEFKQYLERTRLIQRAHEQGLDAICITEHDRIWPQDILRAVREEVGFPIFSGVEVSTNYAEYGHVLVFGLGKYVPGIWDFDKLAQVASDAGAYMIVAHPFREQLFPRYPSGEVLTIDEALEWPVLRRVQALEVFNGATLDRENRFAADVCGRMGLKGTGGSDAHTGNGLGTAITIFEDELRNEADLVAALHAGRFKAATCQRHTGYREWPAAPVASGATG